MNNELFFEILKIQSNLNTGFGADKRIKKDFERFNEALSFLNTKYNKNIMLSLEEYNDLFQEMINQQKLIKTCCNRYKVIDEKSKL